MVDDAVRQRGVVALAVVLAVVALALKGVLSSEATERLLSGSMAFAAGFLAAGAAKGLDRPPG